MLQVALLPLRTSLALLLLTDLVSPSHVVEYSVGDAVTMNCSVDCSNSVSRDITQTTWRKHNNSHFLLFSKSGDKKFSNFSEPRFSFEDPPVLRITEAQPTDSGNYTCEITASRGGLCKNIFSLYLGENNLNISRHNTVVYASSSGAGVFILIIVIVAIVYWRIKSDKSPDKIHQTSQQPQQTEEPIYDNADQNYCLRFNSLYDGLPAGRTMQSVV